MLTVSVKYVGYKNYNKHNIRGFKNENFRIN